GQERRELAGIEMIGIVREPAILRVSDRLRRQAVIAEPSLRGHEIAEASPAARAHPVRHEIHLGEALRNHQRMIIGVILRPGRPAGELSSLLERGIALAEKRGLRYA